MRGIGWGFGKAVYVYGEGEADGGVKVCYNVHVIVVYEEVVLCAGCGEVEDGVGGGGGLVCGWGEVLCGCGGV